MVVVDPQRPINWISLSPVNVPPCPPWPFLIIVAPTLLASSTNGALLAPPLPNLSALDSTRSPTKKQHNSAFLFLQISFHPSLSLSAIPHLSSFLYFFILSKFSRLGPLARRCEWIPGSCEASSPPPANNCEQASRWRRKRLSADFEKQHEL